MPFRKRLSILLAPAALFLAAAVGARAEAAPDATPKALYDSLLKVMKDGPALGFAGRVKVLDPDVRADFNLPLMTRLVVGPPWRLMKPSDQQDLVAAFSDYSVAVYAARFKGYSGEQFLVDPGTTRLTDGDVIVRTRLLTGGGDTVHLDYLLRSGAGGWQIIDVFLSGTISELATRRSEYSSVLRAGGAPALIRLLQQKTAELKS